MGHSGAWLLHDRATCHKAETNRIHGLPGPKSGPGAPRFMAGQMWATWLTRSPRRTVDSLFSCFAVEVLVVGFRIGTGMVYDAVPMIRRRIKRIELQWDIAGIDDVVIHPSRDYYCEPARIGVRTPLRTASPVPSSTRKNWSDLWTSAPISSLGFNAMTTSWHCFVVLSTRRKSSFLIARS